MPQVAVDVSGLDPFGYIRRIGLRPEDCFGFIPVSLEEGSLILYLYRDRSEYEEARSVPEPQPMQVTPMMAPQAAGGPFAELARQAQELQQMYGGVPTRPTGAPGDPLSVPDPDKLAQAAKLRESGAIDDAEFARLLADAGVPGQSGADPAAPERPEPARGPQLVAHRLYPRLRARSSTRQLDHFLPAYCATLSLRSEDTYGVFPWGSRTSSSGADAASSTEWDDYWIVYRDRAEYEAGRETYAREMDGDGRWPPPVTAPGVSEPSGAAGAGGSVEVDRMRWPRTMLVIKQTGGQLGDSLEEKIASMGYESHESFGFCPNFKQSSIYLGRRA